MSASESDPEVGALASVRSGRWRRRSGGTLAVVATVAAFVDLATTYRILTSEEFTEFNVVLDALGGIHPAVAISAFATSAACLVAICWLSFGWLSPVAGWYVVLSMGYFGLSNLLGILTGTWPTEVVPLSTTAQIHYVFPAIGFVVGVARAYWRYRTVPAREVVVVGTIALVAVVAVPRIG